MGQNTTRLCELLARMPNTTNGGYWDKVTGKHWDVGQAICRELYGPTWYTDPRFLAHNDLTDAPLEALRVAEAWIAGTVPEWVEQGDGGPE